MGDLQSWPPVPEGGGGVCKWTARSARRRGYTYMFVFDGAYVDFTLQGGKKKEKIRLRRAERLLPGGGAEERVVRRSRRTAALAFEGCLLAPSIVRWRIEPIHVLGGVVLRLHLNCFHRCQLPVSVSRDMVSGERNRGSLTSDKNIGTEVPQVLGLDIPDVFCHP